MRSLLIAALAVLCACGESEDVDSSRLELAHPGPWSIPPETVAEGDMQNVTRTEAGPWVGESGCHAGFTSGAQAVEDWIYAYWPEVSYIGGYSCRAINGDSSQMSVHATGRALDIHIPTLGGEGVMGEADNDAGDPLANYLIEHAEEMGIQRIIWDRWYWRADPPRNGEYTGRHPHHDHLHVELSVAAGNMETPWFAGPMDPPQRELCGEPVADHAIIDDDSTCFQRFGSEMFWRDVDGVGEGGHILWTNAFESEDPSNWARWRFHVAEDARYRVEVSSVADYSVHSAVRYEVYSVIGEEVVVIDPSGSDGWHDLGVYRFLAGQEAWVAVYDNYGPVPMDSSITVDAIQLTSLDVEPEGDAGMPSLDGGPGFDAGVGEDAGGRPGFEMSGGCGGCSSTGDARSLWWLALLVACRRRRAVA